MYDTLGLEKPIKIIMYASYSTMCQVQGIYSVRLKFLKVYQVKVCID